MGVEGDLACDFKGVWKCKPKVLHVMTVRKLHYLARRALKLAAAGPEHAERRSTNEEPGTGQELRKSD